MRKLLVTVAVILIACIAFGYTQAKRTPTAAPKQYDYRVIKTYPHDPSAFTQGLEYREGFLYEGTGIEGRSSVRKVELESGTVVQQIPVESRYFGEGITVLNRQIIEITWTSKLGFIYDQGSFQLLRRFSYPGEGWGLANDGEQIYMSDGTADIRILDPLSLQEKRRITVHDGSENIRMLNELEFVRGEIYSNVWQTNKIARISPADGRVVGWVDMTGLLPVADRLHADVLNGIAFDPLGGRLFVTGKLWPKLFEVQLVEKK